MKQKGTYRTLSRRNRRNLIFLAALVSLVTGMFAGGRSGDMGKVQRDAARFEKVLHKKERLLKKEFRGLEQAFREEDPMTVLDRKSPEYQELADRQGITIFFFEKGRLRYWSDHSIPVQDPWMPRLGKPFVSLRNADFVSESRQAGGGRLLGLIEVKTHYPFQNKFLTNAFHKDFRMNPLVEVEFLEAEGTRAVFSEDGTYLFSLDFSEALKEGDDLGLCASLGFLLFVLLGFAGLSALARDTQGRRKWTWMGIITLFLPAMAFIILRFGARLVFSYSELFLPDLYASRFFPSLGHLLVVSLCVLAVVSIHYLYGASEKPGSGKTASVLALVLLFMATVLFVILEQVFRSLVLDSGISFEAHRVTSFSVYTLVGLAVIISWFISVCLLIDRAIGFLDARPGRVLAYATPPITAGILLSLPMPGIQADWISWAGLMLILGALVFVRYHSGQRVSFSRFIFLLLFVSALMTIRLQQYNRIKTDSQKEVELVKLSSEHDPVAEMLFSELSMAVRNDSVLAGYVSQPYIDIDPLVDRLRRNYFSGYWSKYDLQVTACRPDDRVYLEPPDDQWLHCYTFFEDMIRNEGIEIPGSDFYFLDNFNGRISYLASIPYFRDESEHRVFIELDSKMLSEELGYPELLLDEHYAAFTDLDYSYARYKKGVLITRDGKYPYRRSLDFYSRRGETFEKVNLEGYDHTIYHVDGENTIIVGSPSVTLVDRLISFSYLFALNFLLLVILYLVTHLHARKSGFNWTFKNRIQYSMLALLFLTFMLICSGTIYLIVQQYRDRNNDNLRNTMRSVYIELIHKVEYEEDLRNWSSENYYNLDELLRKFSNVFYSDINLYDKDGSLLATSRSEIFDRQLLSRRMNRLVYEIMAEGRASEFIHEEHIGSLKYTSAYVPLLNSENKFLAYLNLPYFTQSGALTRGVTHMVVAVVNIFLILLLVILGSSVFLADRITQPLRVIQNRIARVSLGAKNEMIRYERNDEIRGLVEEYNHMVEELERSAELLARSERESAWREMAKQIAHEIKNPLTPMKLNVQHLQRIIGEGKGDPAQVERISATLIAQIDSLSAIANEFSDFAKMPRARSTRINLVTNLKNLQQLFGNTDRAEITLDLGGHRKVFVYADKEQLTRVFINLVKNGLQSIPEDRKGLIRISLELEGEFARVTVTDNGKGIPEEIRDKLFRPNFTTKSGGMGMGLAISSSIVSSLGGKIWYETMPESGTSFHVELPLLVEKSGNSSGL